jgi:hypothetical protein
MIVERLESFDRLRMIVERLESFDKLRMIVEGLGPSTSSG